MATPVLTLEGNSTGAVKAVGDIATSAQNLKQHFEQAAQAAKGMTTELESGGGAAGGFNSGLQNMIGSLGALVGPGALIGLATVGMKEYADQLERAGHLAPNAGLAALSQLGSQQLGTARGLIAQGTPEDRAAAITQSLEGASAADAAFIRAAAPTNVFNNLQGMAQIAQSQESEFPGTTLPGLIGQARFAFKDTKILPEEGLSQMADLAPLFQQAGISQQAGLALAGETSKLFPGQGASRLKTALQGAISKHVFEGIPSSTLSDPGKLLDYFTSEGIDAENFPGKGAASTMRALANARGEVEARYSAVQGAGESDAYGMLGVSSGDAGLAADQAERARAGAQITKQEQRGIIRRRYDTEHSRMLQHEIEGLSPLEAAPTYVGYYISKFMDTMMATDGGLQNRTEEFKRHTAALEKIAVHAEATERNTRGGPQPGGVQE